jgi:hypothetical protein
LLDRVHAIVQVLIDIIEQALSRFIVVGPGRDHAIAQLRARGHAGSEQRTYALDLDSYLGKPQHSQSIQRVWKRVRRRIVEEADQTAVVGRIDERADVYPCLLGARQRPISLRSKTPIA